MFDSYAQMGPIIRK